ncbi:unnamed protein product [Rotaria sp. Silwood1]|nr:unnamed protein product [Rotaria sp. Silwood1]
MLILVIFLSYLLGCASTIAVCICLFILYGIYSPGTIFAEEQYPTVRPLSQYFEAKNSTVDAVNYILNCLFQELKDTSKLRRYIMQKLHIEFDELKQTRLGKIFLRDIAIRSFSMGHECLIFSNIRFERQVRDERQLIKEVVAKLNGDYQDGFSCTLDITLAFGHQCQLYIKVNRIQGELRLEFRREPFSHWLYAFQDEPLIDLDVRAYLYSHEIPLLAKIIRGRIIHTIRRKNIWPSYKIRYPPFFSKSKQSLPIEIPSVNDNNNFIPGIIEILIKSCDRLSIPFEIFNKENYSLVSIFLTININEQMCKDYLHINRDQWIRKHIEFIPQIHKINIIEVPYMDRTEFLIEEFNPIPDEIEDMTIFKAALEDKNVFLLQIQDQEIRTLKQINRLLKSKSTNGHQQKVKIVVGMPLVNSVQVRRVVEIEDTYTIEKAATVALSELIFDAHMSFKRETETTLNFRPTYSSKSNLKLIQTNSKSQKLAELRTHRGYDDNMANGFVTINFQHQPEIEMKLNQEDKKEFVIEKDDNQNEEQPMSTNEEHKLPLSNSTNHSFEDHAFSIETLCAYCNKKIWTKTGRQCRNCSMTIHKKCEDKLNHQHTCTHESIHLKSKESEDNHSTISTNDVDSSSNTNQTTITSHSSSTIGTSTAAFSIFDLTSNRLFHTLMNKNVNLIPTLNLSNDQLDHKSSSYTEKQLIKNLPISTSSKFINAASLAYSKLLEFKIKRIPLSLTWETKKKRSLSDSSTNIFIVYFIRNSIIIIFFLVTYENISEDDLQDIITKCLSDETIDIKSFENLLHEKAVDHTVLYAKANEFGSELFPDLTIEERKHKFENEISRLQQEIDLQDRIRDEMIIEYNSDLTDENAKRKIQAKITNVDEKVQALGKLLVLDY